MPLSFRHLTSAHQVTRADADQLLATCATMEKILKKGHSDMLHGAVLAALFYEPSTRTRLSFETAMLRLGGQVITADGLQFSSMYKGETVEDTIKVIGGYADIIAMRHPEAGSADRAAAVSPVPFINAGDGPNQHPTQGMLDLLTIHKECGTLQGLKVAIVGDLKFGRTAQSLTQLLALYPHNSCVFVSPPQLAMPQKILSILKDKGIPFVETTELKEALSCDVIYMTRVQKERFENAAEYEALKDAYVLHASHVKGKKAVILHPLPRVVEISTAVDALPNAAYFRQTRNGLIMRMAIIAHMLGKI